MTGYMPSNTVSRGVGRNGDLRAAVIFAGCSLKLSAEASLGDCIDGDLELF